MKKKILFIFLLIFNLGLQCHSQDLLVTYGVSSNGLLNDEQKAKQSPLSKEFFKNAEENFKHIKFLLKIKGHQSVCSRERALQNEGDRGVSIANAVAGLPGVYYTNLQSKEVVREYNGYGKIYLIYSSMQDLKWELTKESRTIAGYKAFKATAIETYHNGSEEKSWTITAWYVPEINKPVGPGGYGGLPGLIFELERGAKLYTVESIEETVVSEKEVFLPGKGTKVTHKEFEDIGKKMKEMRSSFN